MEKTRTLPRRKIFLLLPEAVLATVLLWDVWMALAVQLLTASVLMVMALPLCRLLEKRIPSSGAAALSLALLFAAAALLILLLTPPLIAQLGQLTRAIPALVNTLQTQWERISRFFMDHHVDASPLKDGLFRQLTDQAGGLLSSLLAGVSRIVAGVSKLLLSPLLAFYLLRDRKKFALQVFLLLPPHLRARGLRAWRMIRREMGAYCRGQALLSLAIGGLTALGLLVVGTPGWLLLGVLMGIMELIPYAGPFLAGIPAILLALQNGYLRALWALGAILAVQQIEASFLSPRLLGNAAKLHPMAVLLLISAGGFAAGPLGMLLVIPGTILLRGIYRGWMGVTSTAENPIASPEKKS